MTHSSETTGIEKSNKKPSYTETLAVAYDLPDLEFVGTSPKGISSYNAILKTADGRRFFVKQYKEDDAERRENSNIVERYISKHSPVPIVLPLETITGDSYISIDEKMYTVFIYQDHTDSAPTSEQQKHKQISELAKTLGLIHSTPTTEIAGVKNIERWAQKDIPDRIAHLEHIEAFIRAKPSPDAFDISALKVISERKKMLSQMRTADTSSVVNTLCHGDYHSQNVLFNTEMEVIGVVDWDICGLSDPYVDFLNSFKMTVVGRRYDTYQRDRRDDAKSFIQGYLAGAHFQFEIERLRSAANTLAQVVVGSSWPLDEHYFMDYIKADQHLDGELKEARFFMQNCADMVEFISSVLGEVRAEASTSTK